jgi:hypothetical protein
MSKKNTMKKMAKGIADDISDSKKARMDSLKKMGKSSKQKLARTLEDSEEKAKKRSEIACTYLEKALAKQSDLYYTVKEFEADVYRIEGFKIIVRAATFAKIKKYTYKKRCGSSNTAKYFIEQRLKRLTDSEYEFAFPYNMNICETLSDLRALEAIDKAANALSVVEEE